MNTRTTINGNAFSCSHEPDSAAVHVLRDTLGLTGTKYSCGAGVCGACTVLVNGAPCVTCLMPARAMRDKHITTIEHFGADNLHPIQRAFLAHDGLQCGFCTPG
ncbi:MAG: 2Fe-2S iron-sulfur cluster-binding protein, partial [Gemmatimonadaceae bacterium]